MDRREFLRLVGVGGAAAGLTGVNPPPAPSEAPPVAPEIHVPAPTSGIQRVLWSVETDDRAVALTFDDGPDPRFTPRILRILERYDVKATFMVMGYNAVRYGGVLRDVVAAGHEIGGHGWKHLNLAQAGPEDLREEVEYALDRIEQVTQQEIKTFRPPYGRFGEDVVRMLARKRKDLVIWSVTRGELEWRDPERVVQHVTQNLGPGDILLMHDGVGRGTFQRNAPWAIDLQERRDVEIAALPRILDRVLEAGIKFDRLSDLTKRMRPVDATG